MARRPSFFDLTGSLLTPSEGWLTVALLLAVQMTAVVFVQTSDWVDPMPRLWLLAPVGFLAGIAVAKVRAPLLLALPLHATVIAAGLGLAYVETADTLSAPGLGDKLGETWARLREWSSTVGGEGISNDRLAFALGLTVLAWLMAYASSWCFFKLRWAWVAVILPAVVLLENQTYLPASRYPLPLTFFLIFAVLFVGRAYFLGRLAKWRQQRLEQRLRPYGLVMNVCALTGLVFAIAWALPTKHVTIGQIRDTYQTTRAPWADLEDQWERVFAGIPSQKASPLHAFGPALPLRGGARLGEEPVFTVITDFPAYWRAQSYDHYLGQGWITRRDQRTTVKKEQVAPPAEGTGFRKREVVAQKVVLHRSSDVLFAAGQPLEVNVPAELEVAAPRTFEVDLRGGRPQAGLPPDLARAAERIAASRGGIDEMARLLPPDTQIVRERRGTLVVTRKGPAAPDILSIRSSRRLKPESAYEVLSTVSIATVEDLRGDRAPYPGWVTDNYLQLPDSLPQRVRDLGRELTKDARNAYDRGVLIADHLRTLKETQNAPPPPINVDAVDQFLFSEKAGSSDYFASSMTVLLRSVGVPARLAAGYATGKFDKATSSLTVRLADAHSWPEVFFPTYGWVPFEPSPSLDPIPRGPRPDPAESDPTTAEGSGDSSFLEDLFLFDQPLPDEAVRPEQDQAVSGLFKDIFIKIGLALSALAGLAMVVYAIIFALWQLNFIGLPYAHGVYDRMGKLGALVWAGPSRYQTPGEYASALAQATELRPGETAAIAEAYMKARYAGRLTSAQERQAVQRAWRSVRKELLRRAAWRFDPRNVLRRAR